LKLDSVGNNFFSFQIWFWYI